jgi:hypothetical protein
MQAFAAANDFDVIQLFRCATAEATIFLGRETDFAVILQTDANPSVLSPRFARSDKLFNG